jgi:hypothetical protein
MNKRIMKTDLERKTFNEAIGDYLHDFLQIEGNYEECDGERFLKEAVPFFPQETPQRSPEQVPTELWKQLIKQHFFCTTIN